MRSKRAHEQGLAFFSVSFFLPFLAGMNVIIQIFSHDRSISTIIFRTKKHISQDFYNQKIANSQKKVRLTGKKGATNKPTEGRPPSFQVMQSQDIIFLSDSTIITPGDAARGRL